MADNGSRPAGACSPAQLGGLQQSMPQWIGGGGGDSALAASGARKWPDEGGNSSTTPCFIGGR
jgi:hypothetical protein